MRFFAHIAAQMLTVSDPVESDPAIAERAHRESVWAERLVFEEARNEYRRSAWRSRAVRAEFGMPVGDRERSKIALSEAPVRDPAPFIRFRKARAA